MNVFVSSFLGVFMGMIANNESQKIQEFIDSIESTNSVKIYEYEEKLEQKDTIGAKELMALFDAYSDVEYNYKRVYEIYNRSWLEKQIEFTAEDSLYLREIANQSPRVAGNAVYMARVMLSIDTIDIETYSAKSMNHDNQFIFDQLKLYPNPSTDFIYYELPIQNNEFGWVRIIDVSGKTLTEWSVDAQNTIGSIDVSHYSKGIYLFDLQLTNGKSVIKKLVIK